MLLMAVRSRAYGEMAVNLAVSLRAYRPDIAISVISDGAIESTGQINIFNEVISVPRGMNPFELKTRLNTFSKYEKTLYIDADSVFISDPDKLFSRVADCSFAVMEYKRHDANSTTGPIWATIEEIFSHYSIPENSLYPEYNSSVMFWVSADEWFSLANRIYNSPPCKLIQDVGGFFPDEVAFGVASAILGKYSEIERWQPAYLQWDSGRLEEKKIKESYCLLTRSGAREDAYIDRIMNSCSAKAAKKLGVKFIPFNIKNKIHA